MSAALDLNLHIILTFLQLDRRGLLLPGCMQKVLDFLSFVRRGDEEQRAWLRTASGKKLDC